MKRKLKWGLLRIHLLGKGKDNMAVFCSGVISGVFLLEQDLRAQQCDHKRLLRNHILNLTFCSHWTCKEKILSHSGGKAYVMWTSGSFSSGQSQRPWDEAFASTLDLERHEERPRPPPQPDIKRQWDPGTVQVKQTGIFKEVICALSTPRRNCF